MRVRTKWFAPWVAALGLWCGISGQANADLLTNGNFETGNLTGWTVFTTDNGTTGNGLPDVVSFNTTGSGASNAARFEVGKEIKIEEGGGISQTFFFSGGLLSLSANVAAYAPTSDATGGHFSLLLDNVVESTVNVDAISAGQTIRGLLSATLTVGSGNHTLAILITRPDKSYSGTSPYQYVDNVSAALYSPVPEPSTLLSAGIGGLCLLGWARRRKAAATA